MNDLIADVGDRVRAALEKLLEDPPAEFVRMVRRADKSLSAEDIRAELPRICSAHTSSLIPHTSTIEAYREIERYCLELEPDAVRPQLWKPAVAISFLKGSQSFCDVSVFTGGMRVRLKRDGEFAVRTVAELESAKPLIREAFAAA